MFSILNTIIAYVWKDTRKLDTLKSSLLFIAHLHSLLYLLVKEKKE